MASNSTTPILGADPALDAQSQVGTVYGVAISFSLISLTAVCLRLYTRAVVLKLTGADDVMIVVAEVFALLTAMGASMEAKHGLGRHIWTISHEDFLTQQTWLYVVIIFYNISLNVIKLSFLLQYRRFLAGKWTLRFCNWMAALFIPLLMVVSVVLLGVACFPVAIIVSSMAGKCIPQIPVWYFTGSTSIVTDFIVFLVPLPTILKLRIPNKKQKALLLLIFSLGFFVCAISIMRIMQYSARLRTTDTSWTGVGAACWCMVEIHCGILCSCLATLRPLLRKVFPWLGRSTANTNEAVYALSRTGPGVSAGMTSRRRPRAGSVHHLWEEERRPSFGSAEALKGGGVGGAELTVWADGGDKNSATDVDTGTEASERGAEPGHKAEDEGPKKPLQIYVRQTIVSEEARSKTGSP